MATNSAPTLAITGTANDSFAGDAIVLTNLGGIDQAFASVLQGDGKLIVVGRAFDAASGDFAVVRYNPDGSLDPTFGSAGTLTLDFNGALDEARGVLVQPGGGIVVVGSAFNPSTNRPEFALARFDSSGNLDASFGSAGKLSLSLTGNIDSAYAVAMQPNGSLLVAGEAANGFALTRFDSNGNLDLSYGQGDGIAVVPGFGGVAAGLKVVVQPDGKAVVVGIGYVNTTNNYDVVVARFTADGVLDPSFSGDGFLTLDLSGGFNEDATSVILQPDGQIVVSAGPGNSSNGFDFLLLRFNPDGTPDLSFGGGDGIASVDFAPFGQGKSVVQQGDGKFIVSGTVGANFAMSRFTSNGILDTSFGSAGLVMTDLAAGSNDDATSMLLLPDGRILLTGTSNGDFALVRYNADGSLDASTANLQEDANSPSLMTSGGFAFDDVDIADTHTLTINPDPANPLGGFIYIII